MTKAELIKALEQFDDDMEVCYEENSENHNIIDFVGAAEDEEGKYILLW